MTDLTNANEKKEACEDNKAKDNSKKRMMKPQLLHLHTRWLQNATIGGGVEFWFAAGEVWRIIPSLAS